MRFPRVSPTTRTRLAASALVAVTGLTASACGVSSAEVDPGVAATVGDTTITVDHVDDVAAATCRVLRANDQLGSGISGAALRSIVLKQLALGAAVDQLADDAGFDASKAYNQTAQQVKLSLSQADADDIETAMPVFVPTAFAYLTKVLADGVLALPADADDKTVNDALVATFTTFQQDHDVVTNPLFARLDLADPEPSFATESLSTAVSDLAKTGEADGSDATLLGELPESQQCAP